MSVEIITDNQNTAKMLKKAFTPEQIHHLLETITANYEFGACPLCGESEIPLDEDGDEIEAGEDVSSANWVEVHDEDCLVTWLQAQQGKEAAK